MTSLKRFAVIVAGGSGSRMKTSTPKQFLELQGKPILMHTIDAFHLVDSNIKIVLVLPADHIQSWETLCQKHKYTSPHEVIAGGNSRFQSVKSGISSISETNGLIAIHDGVRPFVSKDVINDCYESASIHGSGVAAVPLKDSIREKTTEGKYKSRERSNYMIVQTPQTFSLKILKDAFKQKEEVIFTDDANVVEYRGHDISLVTSDYDNIKITSPEDLIIAEKIMSSRQ